MNFNKQRLFILINGEIAKGTILVALGSFLSAAFSMIFVYFCSRILSTYNFGLFSICLTTWFLLQEIFDFGLTNLIIRLGGKHLNNNPKVSYLFFKTGFIIRLLLGLIIFLIFLIFGKFFSSNLLQQTNLFFPLLIIAFGEIGAMILTSLTSIIISLKKFKVYALLYIFQGLSRLILLGLAFYTNLLSLNNLVLIIVLPPFLTFILGIMFVPKEIWLTKLKKDPFVIIFDYIKWLIIWGLFMTTSSRIYIYLLTGLKSPVEAGIFNLAYLFASIPILLTTSLSSVILPSISQLSNFKEIPAFFRKSMKVVILLALFILIIMIPFASLLFMIFGVKYSQVTQVFQGLMIGMVLVVLTSPATTILWVFDQPKIFSTIALSQFFLALVLGVILINRLDIQGAVISFIIVSLFVFLITNFFLIRAAKQRNLRLWSF